MIVRRATKKLLTTCQISKCGTTTMNYLRVGKVLQWWHKFIQSFSIGLYVQCEPIMDFVSSYSSLLLKLLLLLLLLLLL